MRNPWEIEQAGVCSGNHSVSVMLFLTSLFPRQVAETGKELFCIRTCKILFAFPVFSLLIFCPLDSAVSHDKFFKL